MLLVFSKQNYLSITPLLLQLKYLVFGGGEQRDYFCNLKAGVYQQNRVLQLDVVPACIKTTAA